MLTLANDPLTTAPGIVQLNLPIREGLCEPHTIIILRGKSASLPWNWMDSRCFVRLWCLFRSSANLLVEHMGPKTMSRVLAEWHETLVFRGRARGWTRMEDTTIYTLPAQKPLRGN